jgi:quercetin dioxygenase-like cupin family protein
MVNDMPHIDLESRAFKILRDKVQARTFWEDKLMLAVVDMEANAELPMHSHPHEQGGVVLKGEVAFNINGEVKTLRPGDLYIIPGDVEHGLKVGDAPAQLLDVFSPVREEFKY